MGNSWESVCLKRSESDSEVNQSLSDNEETALIWQSRKLDSNPGCLVKLQGGLGQAI